MESTFVLRVLLRNEERAAPVQLLEAEPAGIVVIDLMDGVLQHLPCFLCGGQNHAFTPRSVGTVHAPRERCDMHAIPWKRLNAMPERHILTLPAAKAVALEGCRAQSNTPPHSGSTFSGCLKGSILNCSI